jgi:nucleotide-binding universal stress UspA family protein
VKRTVKAKPAAKRYRNGPIICGTDFSVHAAEAAEVAAAMAKALGRTLILAHVVEAPAGEAPAHGRFEKFCETLDEEADHLRGLGATVEYRLLAGSPAEAIAQLATEMLAHSIVVSSIGQIAPSRFLAGSVAERTAEISAAPTVVVRDAASLINWTRRKAALRVLVGCDFSPSSDQAICWALNLKSISSCEIVVAHVNRMAEESYRLGVTEGLSLTENAPAVQRVLERELADRVQALGGNGKARLVVAPSWGRIDAALLDMARSERIDLVVLGTHHRHAMARIWLGSVSRAMLRHAVMNVAIVPEAAAAEQKAQRIPQVRRVLVATDLSEIANRAIPHAFSILSQGGAVCLLHVVEGERNKSAALDTVRSALRQLIPPEAADRGIKATIEVVQHTDVPEAVSQAAERFGADIICIASHGRTGLLRTLLGSVAQAVIARSSRPVFLVRARMSS